MRVSYSRANRGSTDNILARNPKQVNLLTGYAKREKKKAYASKNKTRDKRVGTRLLDFYI